MSVAREEIPERAVPGRRATVVPLKRNAPVDIGQRLTRLEDHLRNENPVLAEAVRSFRSLDRIAERLALFSAEDSFATTVSWWPVIAILGTFSSGKSTFLNAYVGEKIQRTGNQAVDDKFTVICYGDDAEPLTLPGRALDADPRFPFYRVSRDIQAAATENGRSVDSYLQLKACNSERLRGKVFIDSPGFDADAQRDATLRITDHIMDLSDLVLVFFDARHPEPGAMRDTLTHLVGRTVPRADATKFLYVLNQVDNTAREDNPEEAFGAWQRALAGHGLTAGRFYQVYDPDAAAPFDDGEREARFEAKRAADTAEIHERINHIEVERAYGIIGRLEASARELRDVLVPRLDAALRAWHRRLVVLDVVVLGAAAVALLVWGLTAGWPGWLTGAFDSPALGVGLVVVALAVIFYVHLLLRRLAALGFARRLRRDESLGSAREPLVRAFQHNTRGWRSLLFTRPLGWSRGARKKLDKVLTDADRLVQRLNDQFAYPSGRAADPDR